MKQYLVTFEVSVEVLGDVDATSAGSRKGERSTDAGGAGAFLAAPLTILN